VYLELHIALQPSAGLVTVTEAERPGFYKVLTLCAPAGWGNVPTLEMMRLMYRTAVLVLISAAAAAAAQAPVVLQDFGIGNLDGGNWLYAGLVMDNAGNLYGAAYYGGVYNHGVVYKLSPTGTGGWKETVLYTFKGTPRGQDGAGPYSAPTLDSAGNLYGTTAYGGVAAKPCGSTGCGVVYKLMPSGSTWQETVLYRFTATPDGFRPYAGVDIDAAGNLYGITSGGGTDNLGTIFELSPSASGGWKETVIHSFAGADGSNPEGMPVLDAAGNLWGTTYAGGTHNKGVVYKLSPQTGGGWSIHVLHSFKSGTDGANPFAGVTMGPDGSLFGTTSVGGAALSGVAYELSRNASGNWTETILHTFLGPSAGDGANPNGLIFDSHGNLFGTSVAGGTDNPGTIFEISPAGNSTWQEQVLYSFTAGLDGAYPSSSLIMDQLGNLYGTTLYGGPSGSIDVGGVVFEFTP
jgi:uncharacterized repeat protein (TIGR03803 family)